MTKCGKLDTWDLLSWFRYSHLHGYRQEWPILVQLDRLSLSEGSAVAAEQQHQLESRPASDCCLHLQGHRPGIFNYPRSFAVPAWKINTRWVFVDDTADDVLVESNCWLKLILDGVIRIQENLIQHHQELGLILGIIQLFTSSAPSKTLARKS